MEWIRKGKICGFDSWNLDWHKMNTQVPIPYLVDENTLRIFITMCDKNNRGRLGYVDVDPNNPSVILDYSKLPLIDVGRRGTFDEDGVVCTSILEDNGRLYMYYCGYQRHMSYPYSSLAGIAISEDKGKSFYRAQETPILERTTGEMFIRTGAGIYKFGNIYRLFYASGNEWFSIDGKEYPRYSLRYIESDRPDKFCGMSKRVFELKDDEFGITTPEIRKIGDIYQMIYSVRTETNGYAIGYADSKDGVTFDRKDELIKIYGEKTDFDNEMMCYARCIKFKDKEYMFYSGNHYGLSGIGYAERID